MFTIIPQTILVDLCIALVVLSAMHLITNTEDKYDNNSRDRKENKMKKTYVEPYPDLFKPIKVGNLTLKNRIVSSPHCSGVNMLRAAGDSDFSNFTETAAMYYGAIARGGASIVNTGHVGVDPRYYMGLNYEHFNFQNKPTTHDHQLPVMLMMTDLIHSYGAKASIELNHGGYDATPVEGDTVPGPCDKVLDNGIKVVAMDEGEMNKIADYFAEAAFIGKRGGFDIINVHGAHSWLLSQFFSPVSNHRTDEYGGSIENRAKFPLMVVKRIRERVGDDMVIAMRFSAAELVEGGLVIEDAVETIKLFEDTIDLIQCSAGKIREKTSNCFMFPMNYMDQGINTYLAREMKKHVRIPVETVGGINEPEYAQQLIADGTADLVGMARTFIADPDWAEKAHTDHAEDIRPCLKCFKCMDYAYADYRLGKSSCAVNPKRILPHPLPKCDFQQEEHKDVFVIGGGPSGMVSAVELAKKGHNVTIFEKKDKLGGKLNFSNYMPFKYDIKRYMEYLIRQVEKSDRIIVKYNTEVTPEFIGQENPDSIVVAVGAEAVVPPIPGIGGANVVNVDDVYGNEDKLGDKFIIIGGGEVGCETAVHLQIMNKEVEVVEMLDELMAEGFTIPQSKFLTLFYMDHEYDSASKNLIDRPGIDRVKIHTSTCCTKITDKGVFAKDQKSGEEYFIEGDCIINATGYRANQDFSDGFNGIAPDVIRVGDCDKPADIRHASSTGYYTSLRI